MHPPRPLDEETSEKKGVWSFIMLASTSFISWIMAKSVQNSSKLGGSFGVVGGLAYAAWFVGIFTTAVIVYQLRKKGYYSLPGERRALRSVALQSMKPLPPGSRPCFPVGYSSTHTHSVTEPATA